MNTYSATIDARERVVSESQNEQKDTNRTSNVDDNSEATVITAHSSVCDRRLSRAARSLIKRHLVSILKLQEEGDEDGEPVSETTIWDLLDRSLSPAANAANCPLMPTKDLLKHHEEHAQEMRTPYKKSSPRSGVPIRAAIYQQTKKDWKRFPWYRCGFCGKTFSSRFYLDQHMDNHHAYEHGVEEMDSSRQQQDWVCPATSWCPALPFCAQHALTVEPYYGRGSGGLSASDRDHIHRTLWYEAHPEVQNHHYTGCDDHAMYEAKLRCYKMIHDCFGTTSDERTNNGESDSNDLQRRLEHSLCDEISCPNRLHQWFFAATEGTNAATEMMRQHVQEWHDEWAEYYSHHHDIGWMGCFVVMALLFGYMCFFVFHRQGDGNARYLRRKDPRGSRLLQKKRSSSSFLETTARTFRKSASSVKAKNH